MYTEAGLTNFSKVLVDLNSMSIVPDDFYYSTTSSGKRIKYGEAGDCYSASKESCRKGKFQIDLTGTGFRLKVSFWHGDSHLIRHSLWVLIGSFQYFYFDLTGRWKYFYCDFTLDDT